MFQKKLAMLMGFSALAMFAAACDDGNDIGYVNDHNIGAPCTCESSGVGECDVLSVPLPSPKGNGKIVGCENMDTAAVTGGQAVCLRTIDASMSVFAPTVYAPKGYCAVSAVKCEGSSYCSMVEYGDADALTSCASGYILLESKFHYSIAGTDASITNKTCVQPCRDDGDCNADGEMSCLSRKGINFCYHEINLSIANAEVTITKF